MKPVCLLSRRYQHLSFVVRRNREGKEDIELTNIGGLYHTYVISSVADTAHTLLGMLSDKTGDVSLLGRRTPACYHRREFGSDLDELIREQTQTELNGPVNLAAFQPGGDTHLKGFTVDDKTTIQLRLQELQLIASLIRSLDCSPKSD